MEEAIKGIASQFIYKPVILNVEKLKPADSVVLCGMGGSHLAAGLYKIYDPSADIYVHRDYGLPLLTKKRFGTSLYIASSYSGNTEEVVDFAEKAFAEKRNLAVIATGGRLIEFAQKNNVPYVQIPTTGIQPRSAIGFSLLALAKLMADEEAVAELQKLALKLNPLEFQETGEALANELHNKVPVIYSSRSNLALAYNWKIKFNETAKIPAFYNVLPELNHNEMTGFDVIETTKDMCTNFAFVFLVDPNDDPKVMSRMEVLKKLYEDRGLLVKTIELSGASVLEKIFYSLLIADWTSLSLSRFYGTEADKVPMVEEFKKLIA